MACRIIFMISPKKITEMISEQFNEIMLIRVEEKK